jgi:hypothetical protein
MVNHNSGHSGHGSHGANGTEGHDHGHPVDVNDTSGIHGMLVVGEQQIYLSHLPMFMFDPNQTHEHNFQVLLQVSFAKNADGSDPAETYRRDRKSSKETVYTLAPERFRLTDLNEPDPNDPDKKLLSSFKGDLFRGHFERGGDAIHKGVTVNVDRVLYWHEFDPKADDLDELRYLIFGSQVDGNNEFFLAHRITKPPDFDQVLSIGFEPENLSESFQDAIRSALQEGREMGIHSRSNTVSDRLQPGERLTAGSYLVFQTFHGWWADVVVLVNTELYFEEGELRLPATFSETEEEKRSRLRGQSGL